jgi:long-chain fatty acid transport protein
MFTTLPLSGGITAGIGIFSPFGQSNTYPDDRAGRYQLLRISLKTVDIDPAIAYRLDDKFVVGVGLDIQYAHLVRQSALDFGSLCFVFISPGICQASGLVPESADGTLTAAAHNWNVGFNLGAIYELTGSTRIGISYRSTVGHNLSGHAAFQVPANAMPLTQGGLFQSTGLNSKITFPFQLNFGLSQVLDQRFTLLADFDLTGWNSIKSLTLNFANPLQPDQGLVLNWKDSVRVAVVRFAQAFMSQDLAKQWLQRVIVGQFRRTEIDALYEFVLGQVFYSLGIVRQDRHGASTGVPQEGMTRPDGVESRLSGISLAAPIQS